MIEKGNLERVVRLYDEYRFIAGARENLDAGGMIVQMTISGGVQEPAPAAPRMPVSLSTTELVYPHAMIDAIKMALSERIGKIDQELQQLGATSVG